MLTDLTIAAVTGAYAGILHLQRRRHLRFLARIPIRIHVNGTRGKSTTTRLIAAGLRAGRIRTLAKTTGTSPRIIFEDGSERPIIRLSDSSIGEQMKAIQLAAERQVEAVVFECMAVRPEYQWVCEHRIMQSGIGVITNVQLDHTELMGTDLGQVASSLSNFIPQSGKLVTAETEQLAILRARARPLDTEVLYADPANVTDEELDGFSCAPFRENVAIALDVCRLLGIERTKALKGMQEATPDPGALRMCRCRFGNLETLFINALAANDVVSTRRIWDSTAPEDPSVQRVLLFCARQDRLARSADFVKALSSGWDFDLVILAGEATQVIKRRLLKHGVAPSRVLDFGRAPERSIGDRIVSSLAERSVVFAAGNILGAGELIADYFFERGTVERIRPDTGIGARDISGAV